MHAVTVVAHQRLRHEGRGFAVGVRNVVHHVFQDLHFVGLAHQRVEFRANFTLAGGCHLVVMHLGFYAHVFDSQAHGRTDVMQRIDRRDGKVAALYARSMADVAVLVVCRRVPGAFLRVDLVERTSACRRPTNVVEDEELVLRTEVSCVRNAGGFQIRLGAIGKRSRAAVVALHGCRLDNVATQVHRGFVGENDRAPPMPGPASGSCRTR